MATLIGIEKHDVPEWIERAILNVAGKHQDGEPKFRLVWGGNRFIFGSNGIDLINPYRVDRWHLEKRHEGDWEHCYTIGHCPHMGPNDKEWCKNCKMNGGEFVDPSTHFRIIERLIGLIILSNNLQDSGKQRAALQERENQKQEAESKKIKDMVHDLAPKTIPRSYDHKMHISADRALGEEAGFKQVN